jgi:hypothetical protein
MRLPSAGNFIGAGFSTGNAVKVLTGGIAYPLALYGFSLQILLVALFRLVFPCIYAGPCVNSPAGRVIVSVGEAYKLI